MRQHSQQSQKANTGLLGGLYGAFQTFLFCPLEDNNPLKDNEIFIDELCPVKSSRRYG
jgi:hypothetical protein